MDWTFWLVVALLGPGLLTLVGIVAYLGVAGAKAAKRDGPDDVG